jgi:predicted PP-loop superfamily ATPase
LIALAWSRGKDSTATAILAEEHDLKLDKIVTVMPDPFRCLDHDHMSPVRFKPDYTFKEVDNIIRTQKNLDDF